MKQQNSLERIFHYHGQELRTVIKDGEPWFVALDACRALEVGNTADGLRRVSKDDIDSIDIVDSRGRKQNVNIISEMGLYDLILGSRKPEAKLFSHWITHEVLPSLRKTGSYQLPPAPVGSEPLAQFSRWDLLHLAMDAEQECEQLRGAVAELLPKADFFDRVAETSTSFSLGETAKMLNFPGFGRNNLIKFLRAERILMKDNAAMQRYVDRGYFRVVQTDYRGPDRRLRVRVVTRVYERGVNFIRNRMDHYLRQYKESKNAGN